MCHNAWHDPWTRLIIAPHRRLDAMSHGFRPWVHKHQGVSDLLSAARGFPERILPSLPGIMRAIRLAISCKNPGVIIFACSALRQLATGNKEVRS